VTTAVIVGGSSGIGFFMPERMAGRGDDVVVTSRDRGRADAAAKQAGGRCRGIALDLAHPETIEEAVSDIGTLDHLVITAIEQGANSFGTFDTRAATVAVTIKLVGYTETVRALRPRLNPGGSVVLFGGVAKDRPSPGSVMVTAFNGGVNALVKSLALELAPHRVNAVHPGVVGDSPKWRDVLDHPQVPCTPIGRLVTMQEVADATDFLLTNGGVNGQNLEINGGVLLT
jgi:NAD(P)-dependent dehydrogenase (short-subunit alcohol dehydrogenase family)